MWLDLLMFLPLAVLSNTAFPLSFDPVLIGFASTHSLRAGVVFAACGSLCAGLAGIADTRLIGRARLQVSGRGLKWLPYCRGRWFYVFTFLFALLPLPFSVIRVAVLRSNPSTLPYSLAIIFGRLPRYLLVIASIQYLR